jgi:endonuclease/exonuclease/phosphatase family metal-dependent hydrolase
MRNRLRLRLQHLQIVEVALVGLFFISATRFLIGTIYSRFGGASIVLSLDPASIPAGTPGVVDPGVLSNEISFLAYMLALPLLTLILGRFRWLSVIAVILVAGGRALMIANSAITPLIAAAMVFGGGLVYLAMMVRHRAGVIPYLFILGIAIDEIFRAVGNTLDPSWSSGYLNIQLGLSAVLVVISLVTTIAVRQKPRNPDVAVTADYGLMPFWGGIGLGALLFLELSLLALPNAVAGRSSTDYTNLAPLVTLATLLPLIPFIRSQGPSLLGLFDRSVRGWAWMLVMGLFIIFGTRFQGIAAGAALVIVQFLASMMWWWLVRPRAEKERQFTGLWVVLAVLVFLMLTAADNFTYEYAYVQNMPPDLAFLDSIIPPFLRGFRGMGLGVLLLGMFLAALPMIQTRRRIPWTCGTTAQSIVGLIFAAGCTIGVAFAVRPPLIAGVRGVDSLRISTYNIHGGFNEFYNYDLEAVARAIQQSGANVVLLQQVETGRMTSFGVDEALWLARRLGMDTRFFPTNEGLQGLAVLSNVEIVYDDGVLLTSAGNQTGLQRVQIRPDAGVITLYNTRLEFLLETGDGRTIEQQEQQRQLNEIFTILARHYPDGNPGRMLMGGTFNNIPDSALGDQMRGAGFVDPFAGLANELSATFWRIGYPQVRLDYLWVWRRSLIPVGANTIASGASDHRLAVIEAVISNQAR